MAGHSKFKNIQHRKGAQDKKRASAFNKVAREITVAAKAGLPDPASNPRLRNAIIAARAVNLPKDRIDKAIQSAIGAGDGANYEQIRYEGYGPGGVAIIVECLTDNRNRTAADVRSAFTKYGGALGETNSVSFMFTHCGAIAYPKSAGTFDTLFETAVEAGADNVEETDDGFEVTSSIEDFGAVRDGLEAKLGVFQSAALVWKPQNTSTPNEDQAVQLFKLMDVLDEHDDVQHVYANFDLPDEMIERLSV